MTVKKTVFVGTFASSISSKELEIFDGFLSVENGIITNKGTLEKYKELKNSGYFDDFDVTQLSEDQFMMPGFVDCHTHASQFPNIGLGLDKTLLEWLPKYTYPLEMKYKDTNFATEVYDKVVERLLKNGTTTACYFGTMHLEGTMQLVHSAIKYGQRALVGKVSMNVPNSAGYYQDTETTLSEAELFVKKVLELENELVQPVVTPRGGVSCDQELVAGLAKIAKKYNCFVQSHISENVDEIKHVLKRNPDCSSFAEFYDKNNLFENKCVLAHAVHLTDAEMALLSEKEVTVAHCPAANTRINSGLCPVLKLMRNNITVGLGTDVSAGDTASILDVMRRAMDVSMYIDNSGENISWKEAFYLGTLGGAKALNLSEVIGSLEVGKRLDALVVEAGGAAGPAARLPAPPGACARLQRFLYVGDDRNLLAVYVNGEVVKAER